MDPSLYAGYDVVAVLADGIVRPIIEPGMGALPGTCSRRDNPRNRTKGEQR